MWLVLIPFAAPLSPAWLAPGPRELSDATADMETLVVRMNAVGTALGRVQAEWGERLAIGEDPKPCDDPAAASLVARSRVLGASYRDAVQSARVQLDRMEDLWAAPTVVPLLDNADFTHAEELRVVLERHERTWLEAASWHERNVEPLTRRCAVSVDVAPGFAYTGALSTDSPKGVAVIGIGGGFLCPAGAPADGRVVLTDGTACHQSAKGCTCKPEPVLPGAVIGPTSKP